MKLLEHLPLQLDSGVGPDGRIGLVVLSSDHVIEREWQKVFRYAPRHAFFVTRVFSEDEFDAVTLKRTEHRLAEAARLLLPGQPINLMAYGCTAASIVIGHERVAKELATGREGVPCCTPGVSAISALRAFGARSIGVLTPYRTELNRHLLGFLESHGFEVRVLASFNQTSDAIVGRLAGAAIRDGIQRILGEASVDAVFLSCTSVRLADSVCELEQEFGLGITSSSLALAWDALRSADFTEEVPELGRLFTLQK